MGKAKAKAKKKTTGARAKRDRRRKLATEAPVSAEELLASVPGLDALQDVPAFDDLPVDETQQTAFDDFCAHAEEPEQMQLGAVVRLDRGFPLVATADDTFRAEHAVGFAKSRGEDEVLLPAVGDRVAVRRAPGHDMGVIECVLPRRTSFERWRGRARGERQVLCSNVDSVLIVQALGAGEVLLDRVARSLVLALDCDAEPVVVLTKADRCDAEELERDLDRVRRLVGPDVCVIVTSSAEGRGLDEVRTCVPAGSCAMILGESGAGKSTLLKLLMRFWDPTSGAVKMSGRDLRGVNTSSLRSSIGYMTQDTHLFVGTIGDNLRIAREDATDAELDSACEAAALSSLIARLPQGYDTPVAELGDSLSGGERQRIGLARIFLHDAPFVLLDEPTSNLDALNEAAVMRAIDRRRAGKTVVLVSHRASTCAFADRFYSVEHGRIS